MKIILTRLLNCIVKDKYRFRTGVSSISIWLRLNDLRDQIRKEGISLEVSDDDCSDE
jgi:hypothetical protein